MTRARGAALGVVQLVALGTLLGQAVAIAAPGDTTRVSVSSDGVEGNSASWGRPPSIGADGRYVAFQSDASNLVAGDTNVSTDVFVHDRQTGATERVSVRSDGAQGNSRSVAPSISADGRYVAFYSAASNLVAGDTNATYDVFVHDRQAGVTERVSVSSDGAQGNSSSDDPSISADGRYVAFYSPASNLVAGDTNGTWDVFVHDLQSGATERVSVSSGGAQGNSGSEDPSISADGRYVAFRSGASNLVAGGTNGLDHVFVHDRQSGTTELISVSWDGKQANTVSVGPAISADGRYVAFYAAASNLVPGDTNATYDVFVRDRQSGVTERVSVSSDGAQGNDWSDDPSISADGRYVAFESRASNLVTGDTNDVWDVFVHDRQSGATERVSVSSGGTQGNDWSDDPAISADGRYVALLSGASNLVAGDTNDVWDAFVRERAVPQSQPFELTLKASEVAGCKSVTGTVKLSAPAPAEGVVVTLSDNLASASTPATLKILAGATAKTFTVKTLPVETEETGTVSATLGSTTLSQPLAVRPMGLTSVTLSPTTVVGSNEVTGKATLECKAGPGPIMVDLGSNKPGVAYPVAANLSIPVGIQSQAFDVMTNPVLVKTSATISGTANGITKSKTLNVTSAASVSPTSLKFGNVPVNTTSVVLSTTLYNKGAVPYVIDGITLTGTNAKYYAQTSDCGATLEAGTSCTIGVTFTPTVTGSRSAKLSIATSATNTPLSVSLSGTGVLPP